MDESLAHFNKYSYKNFMKNCVILGTNCFEFLVKNQPGNLNITLFDEKSDHKSYDGKQVSPFTFYR